MIAYTCPNCGNQLQIPDQYAGQRGTCKHCHAAITVPPAPKPWGAVDLEHLDIDPDKKPPPPVVIPDEAGESRLPAGEAKPWVAPVGWVLFAVGLVCACAGLPFITAAIVLASTIIVAVDASAIGLMGGQVASWSVGTFLLWLIVFPVYLIRRNKLEPRPDKFLLVRLAVLIAIVVVLVVLLAKQGSRLGSTFRAPGIDQRSTSVFVPRPTASVPAPRPASQVTLANFNRLQNGMSYQQVVQILGREGTVMSSSHIDGVPGAFESVDTVMYVWEGPGGIANMNAMFQNNKLITKAQLGLR